MDSPTSEYIISASSTVVATEKQVSADLAGEAVILSLQSGMYYGLDQIGAYIWTLIQEPKTVVEIRDAILDEYDVEPDRCERDAVELLERLADAGLVEVS
jgi:hypothetical protein